MFHQDNIIDLGNKLLQLGLPAELTDGRQAATVLGCGAHKGRQQHD